MFKKSRLFDLEIFFGKRQWKRILNTVMHFLNCDFDVFSTIFMTLFRGFFFKSSLHTTLRPSTFF